jgi:hypothetical protein
MVTLCLAPCAFGLLEYESSTLVKAIKAAMVLLAKKGNKRVYKGGNQQPHTTRLIACGAFRSVLDTLKLERRYRNVQLTFLPSNLHVRPDKLKRYLSREVRNAQRNNERVICLYGECFPDIDEFCERRRIIRTPGLYCYEMLLGSDQFHRIMDETAGTYFLERELIENFDEYCAEPLELYDEEMRKSYFKHYRRLLYVRQPSDPDLVPRARELSRFLDLSLEIRDADYLYLEEKLTSLIEGKHPRDDSPRGGA